jgi:hypothetical protein
MQISDHRWRQLSDSRLVRGARQTTRTWNLLLLQPVKEQHEIHRPAPQLLMNLNICRSFFPFFFWPFPIQKVATATAVKYFRRKKSEELRSLSRLPRQ